MSFLKIPLEACSGKKKLDFLTLRSCSGWHELGSCSLSSFPLPTSNPQNTGLRLRCLSALTWHDSDLQGFTLCGARKFRPSQCSLSWWTHFYCVGSTFSRSGSRAILLRSSGFMCIGQPQWTAESSSKPSRPLTMTPGHHSWDCNSPAPGAPWLWALCSCLVRAALWSCLHSSPVRKTNLSCIFFF